MKNKNKEIFELSKGIYGSLCLTENKETCFKFDKNAIEKNQKLKNEFNKIVNEIKKESINGILKFHSLLSNKDEYYIFTELIKNNLANMIEYRFKIFEIRKTFLNFNKLLNN